MRALLFLMVVALGHEAQANPDLDGARREIQAVQFKQAAARLRVVSQDIGLTRAEAVEFFLLDGLVKGSLGDAHGARDAFARGLVIDPQLTLAAKASPRVMTPWLEAKGIAKAAPPLTLAVTKTVPLEGGFEVLFGAPQDVLELADQIVFDIEEDDAPRTLAMPFAHARRLELMGSRARVRWRIINGLKWVLAEGELAAMEKAATAVAAVQPPPVAPAAAPPQKENEKETTSLLGTSGLRLRAGIGLVGAVIIPGDAVGVGFEGRLGIQFSQLLSVYVNLLGYGFSSLVAGGSLHVEFTPVDFLALGIGPGASFVGFPLGDGREALGAAPTIDARIAFMFGSRTPTGRRHGFSIAISALALFVTQIVDFAQAGQASAGFLVGVSPRLTLGYDAF
jgi:hypothetical protein